MFHILIVWQWCLKPSKLKIVAEIQREISFYFASGPAMSFSHTLMRRKAGYQPEANQAGTVQWASCPPPPPFPLASLPCCHDKGAAGATLQKMMYNPWNRHRVQIKIRGARTFITAPKPLWWKRGWQHQESSARSPPTGHTSQSNQHHCSWVWAVGRKAEPPQRD